MTHDDDRKAPDVRWRSPGVGHQCGWQCGRCSKPQNSLIGRRLKRVRGAKTWVCVGCAK